MSFRYFKLTLFMRFASGFGQVQVGLGQVRSGQVGLDQDHIWKHLLRNRTRIPFRGMWKNWAVSGQAKVEMFEGILAPAVLYGSDSWVLNTRERKRVYVLEVKCLRAISGV